MVQVQRDCSFSFCAHVANIADIAGLAKPNPSPPVLFYVMRGNLPDAGVKGSVVADYFSQKRDRELVTGNGWPPSIGLSREEFDSMTEVLE